jgi:1-phosphofructokinase
VIITLTPNPSIDRTLEISLLTPGGVHRATAEHEEPSGKGVNVSRALTRNGVASLAILPVGGSVGAQLESLLRAERVDFETIPIAGAVRVNISLTEPGGRATKINAAGPQLSAAELSSLTDALLQRVREGDWVVASGSLPRGVSSDYYATICRLVHEAGGRFALDTSAEPFLAGLSAGPDVIKPNVEELEEAVGRPINTLGDAVAAAQQLMELGARSAVVSMGSDGALLIGAGQVLHALAQALNPRSTIGAGDALLAGFIAGGGDGENALREAVAWGTAAVGTLGSHVPIVTDQHRSVVHTSSEPALERQLHPDRTAAAG